MHAQRSQDATRTLTVVRSFHQDASMVPPDTPDHDFMVVGIGASAGGLKALTELFEHVPEHIGMAFVVIVHLSPEHESRLPDLLQQATTMPGSSSGMASKREFPCRLRP